MDVCAQRQDLEHVSEDLDFQVIPWLDECPQTQMIFAHVFETPFQRG
jgi:hypothetical protein